MAKRKEDTPPPGAPAWMATFSDLMNLLLCFFVMLFAMSTLEESKLQEMVAAMNNSISIFEKGATAIGEGILISNGVSQLNELDQFINSTGKTADSKTDGDNMEEYDQSSEAMEQYLQEEKLKENEELAERIGRLGVEGVSQIVFVIGGSLGLSGRVMERADFALSFSKMTFPHQLMRVILLEQVYRSYRILNHQPYHK